jgi:hypothetical protein
VNLHGIEWLITGRLDVVGGTTNGVALTEGTARLIRSFRVRHDGDDRVGILDGRQLYALGTASRLSIEPLVTAASGAVQADTVINARGYLPFALPWLSQPGLTCWPGALPVRTELAAIFEWNTATSQAASSPGSGAIIQGGDRVVTFDQGPTLELVLVYSTGDAHPWYMTRYVPRSTDNFVAANPQLPLLLNGNRRIAAQLFRSLQTGAAAFADKFNGILDFSLLVANGALRYYDRINGLMVQDTYQGLFPAYDDLPLAEKTGQWLVNFVDAGMLSTALDPRALSNPQWQFNVPSPSPNTGVVDVVSIELDVLPGVTVQTI